jgi:hypothetical protein
MFQNCDAVDYVNGLVLKREKMSIGDEIQVWFVKGNIKVLICFDK